MNHEQATKYFDDLGDQVAASRPPIGDIVRAGKDAQRRKAHRSALGIAAAVALVVGGGVTLQQWTAGEDAALDPGIADTPTAPASPNITPLPSEAAVGQGPCPPVPASSRDVDPAVPAPNDATGLTVNDSGTVAAWFEPMSGRLPFLVVYDLTAAQELAREDLGVGDDLRSESLRIDDAALYYQSSADAKVWLRYRWAVDDFPSVYVVCPNSVG